MDNIFRGTCLTPKAAHAIALPRFAGILFSRNPAEDHLSADIRRGRYPWRLPFGMIIIY
jgi:hypothetical protein